MRFHLPRAIKDFAALSGGELAAKIAGFAAFAYLSRVLGPPAYGAVELAVALVTFFSLLVDFGFGPVAAAEITLQKDRAPRLAAQVPAARFLLAIAAFAAVIGSTMLLDLTREIRVLIWVFAISLFLHAWTQNWLFQGLGLISLVAPAQMLRMVALAIGAFLFINGPEHLWRVGGIEVGAMGTMVLYYLVAQVRIGITVNLDFDLPTIRSLGRQALPISASQLLWAFSLYAPTMLVAALSPDSEVAWFGSSLRLVVSLNTFIFLYFFNLYPSLVQSAAEPKELLSTLVSRSFRVTAWAGILLGLTGSIAAEPICRLAYGHDFAEAGATLAVLVWILPISLLSGHARFSLIAYGHQTSELLSAAAGAIVTVILGLVLVPAFGSIGASLAMVGAAVVVWLTAHQFSKHRIGPFPLLGPAIRPAVAAIIAFLMTAWFSVPGGWHSALVAAVIYTGLAPLLDPTLVRLMRELERQRRGK